MRITNKKLCVSYQGRECLICQTTETTVGHHIITKGRGGPDLPWNLMPLCWIHHRQVHEIGLYKFSIYKDKKYDHYMVESWLVDNGWQFTMPNGKWLHPDFRY